jgi:hypothetical protein
MEQDSIEQFKAPICGTYYFYWHSPDGQIHEKTMVLDLERTFLFPNDTCTPFGGFLIK